MRISAVEAESESAVEFAVEAAVESEWFEAVRNLRYATELHTECSSSADSVSDWELAMSYAIAHYMTIIAQQQQAPSGSTLAEVAGGGVTRGVLSTMSIGDFSKTYDIDKTMVSSDDAMFWNQTSYGAALMTLYKTKAVPSIFVVTSNPIPGAN